jgi:cbb3-type cytochrome oxidase subunit 3
MRPDREPWLAKVTVTISRRVLYVAGALWDTVTHRLCRPWTFVCVLVLSIPIILINAPLLAQQPSRPPDLDRVEQEISTVKSDIGSLKDTVDKSLVSLRDSNEQWWKVFERLQWFATIFGFLFGLLLVWYAFQEQRRSARQQAAASELRTREQTFSQNVLTLLQVSTDALKSQAATDKGGIKQADETLSLINNLLRITERAAARAAGVQFDFLSTALGALSRECERLVADAKAYDERDIATRPDFRERVRILAKQIDQLDNQRVSYNQAVPQSDSAASIRLPHPCLFIRGMASDLDQNPTEAINNWLEIVKSKEETAVVDGACYWLGYVYNTIGYKSDDEFNQVKGYLAKARSRAEVSGNMSRLYELTRVKLETDFFRAGRSQMLTEIVEEGDKFYSTSDSQFVNPRAKAAFATTMGNIVLIRDFRKSIVSGTPFAPAEANAWFDRAGESHWAKFGRCQALLLAGVPFDENMRKVVEDIAGIVAANYFDRIEDRTKLLCKITEYLCKLMLDPRSETSTIEYFITTHAANVTGRTIYSQLRKQNISKEEFLKEWRVLCGERNILEAAKKSNAAT